MPLSYLEGNPENVYAINRLGDTFSNAVLGLQQNRARMQQQAAQQALEQAYFRLAQQKEQAQLPMYQAQSQEAQARVPLIQAQVQNQQAQAQQQQAQMAQAAMIARLRAASQSPLQMQMVQDPTSGPQMMGDLRSAGVAPQGAFQMNPQQLQQALQAALGGQVYGAAAATPSGPARLADPTVLGPGQTAFDPFGGAQLAQSPMRAGVDPSERKREFEAKQKQAKQLAIAHMLASSLKPTKEETTFGVDPSERMGQLNDMLRGIFGGESGGETADATFDTEQAARSSGKKAGDKVRIKGVGLVQLN